MSSIANSKIESRLGMAKNTPPGLNHFTCYPVRPVGNATYGPPNPVFVKDEFANTKATVSVDSVPSELCLPAKKVIGNKTYPILNPDLHLLCYTVTKTPIKNPVYVQNQFGFGKMHVISTQWLCLPSTKQIIVGPSGSQVSHVDVGEFGQGGMRGNGNSSITVSGLSGSIAQAWLYWHGPTSSNDPNSNAAVNFNGRVPIVLPSRTRNLTTKSTILDLPKSCSNSFSTSNSSCRT